MKKVRFESPLKSYKVFEMNENECHFPRPFIERQISTAPSLPSRETERMVPYNPDPEYVFEYGNLSPYPNVGKTQLRITDSSKNSWTPCNDLDLSMLDSSNLGSKSVSASPHNYRDNYYRKPLSVVNKSVMAESNLQPPPNVLNKADDFFLRRENISQFHTKDSLYSHFDKLTLDKENNPLSKKMQLMTKGTYPPQKHGENQSAPNNFGGCLPMKCTCCSQSPLLNQQCMPKLDSCRCAVTNFPPCACITSSCSKPICCDDTTGKSTPKAIPKNCVDKKNWMMEKFGQTNKACCESGDVEKFDDKLNREPSVSDLFKIIKLQNEQLQMLQEKVDKLISNKQEPITQYLTRQVAMQSVEDQKMSIGVMTSFEMVRTSTIINKEVVSQNEAQIQCNRSQISIKEVVTKSQPIQVNFLDGIPMTNEKVPTDVHSYDDVQDFTRDLTKKTETVYDDKTYNEISLYNVQVDNATTPLMSPEQSLYLDVRDYSDSDSGGDEQSNVGWTYYNKVMTHVNGMLHESDMPSSASALYRNTRQKCLQMQIDKTNVSVAKRVTFGDDPLGMQQQNIKAATDISLKMNQLAAKYLKSRPILAKSPSPRPVNNGPMNMSYATRNYMEKHKLLPGDSTQTRGQEIPKFLDITALKQQPKFL